MLQYEDQTVTSRSWEFCFFLDSTGTGKFGPKKKYRNRHRTNLIPEKMPVPEKIGPEKSTGSSTGKIWSQKKIPVPEKIGPEKKYQ